MSTLKFAETHTLVSFLSKPEESVGFEEISDFLNSTHIKYALTINPTVYESCIEQFWATAKAKTVNGERQIQALVDKKKKQSRRKQRKDSGPTEPITDEATNEEHVSTPFYYLPQSGEDRLQLTELMSLCTNLQKQVLDLEEAKTAQANEIASLKKREDASKQGRKIADIDQDAEVTLIDETQRRSDDNLMFDIGVLAMAEKEVDMAKKDVSTTGSITTASEAVTTATKPKAVTTATTTTTTTRPKARGVVVQESSEFTTTTSPSQASQLLQAKDKGKAKMVEPEKPLKKKDQIAFDEEVARNLKAQLQAELEEEERLARQKEEEANIALIESWDNTQAMMDADF
ncbi:hypothetical protein Tco_1560827 [Tanacetum coccineum]